MKFYRALTPCIAIVVSLAFTSVWGQEAVETKSSPASMEPTPIEQESPAPKKATSAEEKRNTTDSDDSSAEVPGKKLQEMMGPEKFKAAGLDKLSPEELKTLEASMTGYRRTVETKATEKATAEVEKKAKETNRARLNQIESRVDGILPRVTGRSIIRLEDGTAWKQANPEDHFPGQIIDHPRALVIRTAFGYKMRISGLPEFYVDPWNK